MKSKLNNIQILRAVAAILVVLVHAGNELGELVNGIPILFPKDFVIGVDIFFVISGFIIVYTSWSLSAGFKSALDFMVRRTIRVVPIYWFYTTLMLLVTFALSSRVSSPSFDLAHIFASYIFSPAYHPTAETYQPLLRVGWTLNYEMLFYSIFAIALCFGFIKRFLIVFFGILALVITGWVFELSGAMGFYARDVVLSFLYGFLIGLYAIYAKKINSKYAVVMLVAAVCLYLFLSALTDLGRGLRLGLPAALIVLFSILYRCEVATFSFLGRIGVALGGSSYSLYLSHMFVIGFFKVIFEFLGISGIWEVFILSVLVSFFCIAIGHLLFLFIEQPVHRFLMGLYRSKHK